MPLRGIHLMARSLSLQQQRQEQISNNLSNANTTGFKADRITAILRGGDTAPVADSSMDFSQGTLEQTGRTFDLALNGPGFFVMDTANGERLTRAGSFQLDPAGILVDVHGNAVLGEKGPIPISGSEVTIRADGTVVENGEVVDRLRIESAPPAALRKEGASQFVLLQGMSEPVDPAQTRVLQGSLEDANVDTVSTLVDMISAQRAFGRATNVMRTLDGVMSTVANNLGRVS